MKFVIIGIDGAGGQEKRKNLRPAHLERLKQLDRQGKLVLAGPFADRSGSLIIMEAESEQEARDFIQGDPYVEEGVFEKVEIRPFTQVFPEKDSLTVSSRIPNTLIYDRDCELCRWSQGMLSKWDRRRRIRYLAFQDPEFIGWFPDFDRDDPAGLWPRGEPPRAMLFIDGEGQIRVGMEAFRRMLPHLAGGRLLAVLFHIPGVPWLASRFYDWIARNRYRIFGPSR